MSFRPFYRSVWIIFLSFVLLAQEQPADHTIEQMFTSLQAYHAELFFPERFQKLAREYEALQNAQENGHLNPQRWTRLRNALDQLLSVCQNARHHLDNLLAVRRKAVQMGAVEFAGDIFQEADRKLQEAAQPFLDGNPRGAMVQTRQARQLYFRAMYETIRRHTLPEIRILLRESENLDASRLVPHTYRQARSLLRQMERRVRQSRFDDPLLYQQLETLEKITNHLLYLVQIINPMHQAPEQIEAFILKLEKQIEKLAEELGHQADLGKGLENTLSELTIAAANLRQENAYLRGRVQQLEQERQKLLEELRQFRTYAQQQAYIEAKLRQAMAAFKQPLITEGETVVVRIDSLEFPENEARLLPGTISRLRALAHALREVPFRSVTLRYVEPVWEPSPQAKELNARRAAAIGEFFRKELPLLADQIFTVGKIQPITDESAPSGPVLEATLRLNIFLGYGYRIGE